MKTPKNKANGSVAALFELKKQNRNLKVLLSIGGWTSSSNFSKAAVTDAGRTKLAETGVAMMGAYGFDGIDIDWEYLEYEKAGFSNAADFTKLLKAMRAELDSYATKNAPGYRTSAMPILLPSPYLQPTMVALTFDLQTSPSLSPPLAPPTTSSSGMSPA